MGRMLESLKKAGQPSAGGFATRMDKAHLPMPAAESVESDSSEVPFIEIGAPGKVIEGSPAVLAGAKLQAKVVTPRQVKNAATLIPTLSEPKPRQVIYEPWPRAVSGLRPVASEIIAFHQPEHTVSKQYADLLSKMLEGVTVKGAPVLLLCGSAAGVGTTTVLLNLAVCGSRTKSRVVVVDANGRPALAERLGVEAYPGWNDLLAGTAPLEQAVHSLSQPKLSLLPGGLTTGTLKVEAVRWIIAWLRDRFDLILIDGPEASQADVPLLASTTDAVYLVVPDADLQPVQINALTQPLSRNGGRVRGLIRTHYEG